MSVIVIYRARDGRWAYCERRVRHWNAHALHGAFQTQQEALQAALADPALPKDSTFRVERA